MQAALPHCPVSSHGLHVYAHAPGRKLHFTSTQEEAALHKVSQKSKCWLPELDYLLALALQVQALEQELRATASERQAAQDAAKVKRKAKKARKVSTFASLSQLFGGCAYMQFLLSW